MASATVTQSARNGVTLDQLDEMIALARKVEANLGVMAVGGHVNAPEHSTSTIAYDCAQSMGVLIETINSIAPTANAEDASPVAAAKGRPAFRQDVFNLLVQAGAVVQVINTAAYQADAAEGIGGSAWAVTDMLAKVEEYVETTFKITEEESK